MGVISIMMEGCVKHGVSCVEFILHLYRQPSHGIDHCALQAVQPLPESWRERASGRRIVCLYGGKWLGRVLAGQPAEGVRDILSCLRESFGKTRDALLWWFDDGSIAGAFEEYEQAVNAKLRPAWNWPWESAPFASDLQLSEDETAKEHKRLLEARRAFAQEIEAFRADVRMVYDDSEDTRRVLAWCEAFYGDASLLQTSFQREGKLALRLDVTRLGEWKGNLDIASWVAAISANLTPAQEAFVQKMKLAGKCILLCYISREMLLRRGKAALEQLARLLEACDMRQDLAAWWLADADTEKVLSCLDTECAIYWQSLQAALSVCESGFYDSDGVLSVALSCCDAYYGTPSAAAANLAAKGMPVVWLDDRQPLPSTVMHGMGQALSLNFIKGCWLGDDYYFSSWRQNGLFRLRRGSEQAEYIRHFPVKVHNWRHLFGVPYAYSQSLYFMPVSSQTILGWDRETDSWSHYDLDPSYAWKDFVWFNGAFREGNTIWLKPVNYGAIVRFYLPTQEISYYTGWEKRILQAGPDELEQYVGPAAMAGTDLWLSSRCSGCLVRFSMKTFASVAYEVPEAEAGFASLAYDGTALWLYTRTDELIRWLPGVGVTKRMPHILEEHVRLGDLICAQGCLWVFAHYEDAYVKYDLTTQALTRREHYLPEELRPGLGAAQLSNEGEYIYITPNFGELTIRFDCRMETVEIRRITMATESEACFVREAYADINVPLGEGAFYNVQELAMYLGRNQQEKDETVGSKCIGQKIYEVVAGMMEG